jgi:PAS domain S-box-containing protein
MDLSTAAANWLTEQAQQGIFTCDLELRIRSWNRWLEVASGRPAAEVVGRPLFEVYPEIVERRLDHFFAQAFQGQAVMLSQRLHKYLLPLPVQGHYIGFTQMQQSARLAPLLVNGQVAGVIGVIEDATERIAREEELRRQIALHRALHEIDQAILALDLPQCLQRVADSTGPLVGAALTAVVLDEGDVCRIAACAGCAEMDRSVPCAEDTLVMRAIHARQAHLIADRRAEPQPPRLLLAESRSAVAAPLIVDGKVIGALVVESPRPHAFGPVEQEMTVSLATQAAVAIQNARLYTALRDSEAQYRTLAEISPVGIFMTDSNGRQHYLNERGAQILGLPLAQALQKDWASQVHEDDWAQVQAKWMHAFAAQEPIDCEIRLRRSDETIIWVHVAAAPHQDATGKTVYIGVLDDITQRRQAEAQLHATLTNLARSNADLQQFAYVASHDLQEPLRMVTSYVQLLGMRYQGQLDADADEFIGYAVDGAKRMQQLILDLLEYARVETHGQPMEPTDMMEVCRIVAENLQVAIAESGAQVTWDPLPTVKGDRTQLGMVLQNLIGNAIKFRGAAPPVVHISARKIFEASETSKVSPPEAATPAWEFAVRDNGIGIAPQFYDRIFVIFQRLHTRQKYPGTGIGLAICKKIVERHGGRIWVESTMGEGATFRFSLPAV